MGAPVTGQTAVQPRPARNVRLVAIPIEHGGWAFLLEAVLLGLLVAFSVAGLWLSVAALAVFLVRHPLKLVVADRRKGARHPRTILAERFLLGYSALALVSLGLAFWTAQHPFWLPLLLAAPIAALQAYYDFSRKSRAMAAELAGAVAISAAAASIAMAGGRTLGTALGMWAILAVAAVTSILYVRARLRLERNEPIDRAQVWTWHVIGFFAVAGLVWMGLAPGLALVAIALLDVRAAWGLSPWRRRARAPIVGTQEIAWGLVLVVLTAAGYALHV